jgi:DNA-binding NtrC family response regulator
MPLTSKGSQSGLEVLVLEDDAMLRSRLAAHLNRTGALVTEAGSLAEARRALPDARFDFAATDLHLADGEGLDLLREHAFSENTEVVVMTAFGGVKRRSKRCAWARRITWQSRLSRRN